MKKLALSQALIALEALSSAALFGVILISAYATFGVGTAIAAALLCAALAASVLLRRSFGEKASDAPGANREALMLRYDKSAKRLINSAFMLAALASKYLSVLLQYAFVHGSRLPFGESFLKEGALYAAGLSALLFFAIRHAILRGQIAKQLPDARVRAYRRWFWGICAFIAAYWLAGLAAQYISRWRDAYLFTWQLLAFGALWGIYLLALRKRIVFINFRVNVARIAIAALIAGAVLLEQIMTVSDYGLTPFISVIRPVPGQAREISYESQTGVYTLTAGSGAFRILQLTDIHLGGGRLSSGKDIMALTAIDALLRKTEPDLVIVTGDLVYPVAISSFSLNSIAPATQFAAYMRNTGVPWAFTYGNHDTERLAHISAENFNGMLRALAWRTSGNFLYPYTQPEIYGRSNQLIRIVNRDGSLRQALFLLDSNSYAPGGIGFSEYDYIRDDQVDWYAENVRALSEDEGRLIPSMIFFHIPLTEYALAKDAYLAGDADAVYFYGTADTPICASEHKSKLFDTALSLGSTKAMFCGHDHYNNLSVEYRGIRLTYGMSIDYIAEPGIAHETAQRGATLIEIASDGSFEITPVPLEPAAQ